MRYRQLLAVAAFVALTASCMVSEPESVETLSSLKQKELTITATSGEPDTRTERAVDGSVLWCPGDQISLFYGSGADGGSCFTAQNIETAKTVNFTGTIGVITGGNNIAVEDTYFWAVYPYNATATCDGNSITTVLPSEQVATADTFADDLFPSMGRSQGLNMSFYNICGGIKFTVSEEGIKSVTLKGNSGEQIAGTITVAFDSNNLPAVTSIADGTDSITLSAPDGETFIPGKAYYIVLVPTVFESGFTLTFSNGSTCAHKEFTSKITIRRSVFGTLTTPDKDLEWELLSTAVPPDNEIWYTTKNNTKIDLYTTIGFGANVVSNTYSEVKGVIRFDGPITAIASNVFPPNNGAAEVTHIMIPTSVKDIKSAAFYNCFSLVDFHIPSSVLSLGDQCFMNCYSLTEIEIPPTVTSIGMGVFNCDTNLERFTGNHPGISADGRCLIINNTLNSFAPKNIEEYTFPSGIETIGFGAVSDVQSLKRVILPPGLKHIEGRAFDCCSLLEEIVIPEGVIDIGQWAFRNSQIETVHIPSTVESIGNAVFGRCQKLKRFTGKFASEDGLFLVVNGEIVSVAFAGMGKRVVIPQGVTVVGNQIFEIGIPLTHVEEVVLPEGLTTIGTQAFSYWTGLKRITIPSTVQWFGEGSYLCFGGNPFEECHSLESFDGDNPYISSDRRCLIKDGVLISIAPGGLNEFVVPDEVKEIGFSVFGDGSPLTSVVLLEGLEYIDERAFRYCHKLSSIVLPSTLKMMYSDAFYGCDNLTSVYCKALIPPVFWDCYVDYNVHPFDIYDMVSHAETASPSLRIFVPIQSEQQYKDQWVTYSSRIEGYYFQYDFYLSTDYAADGTTTTLQQSTVGSGVDLVLMGDAFSDRQIADGTYANVMQKAADAFFSEEPYKSMKERFNVYTVNVVSATEGYEHTGQALGTKHGDGTYVYGNDSKVIEYAKKAISEDRLDDAVIIVMMNEDAYAGTCFMYNGPSGNYGRGLSIAYFPTSSDTDTFNGMVLHEASGHGFAKLADEYAYEYMGVIPEDAIASTRAQEPYGWWKNVDFTSDPAQVKWSQFLNDERYAGESLGCFEGGLTYWTGVWRPTENSIMRYNTGGFNAPSRYAIWYRINKLAYGEDWDGTYEDFVAFDAPNRTPAAAARRAAKRANYVEKQFQPLAPPVVVGHSWREELSKAK